MLTEGLQDIEDGILLIPGGRGTRQMVNDKIFIDEIRRLAESSKYCLTVCTGSAVLAKTGLLNGRHATSNKKAMGWAKTMGPEVIWQDKARCRRMERLGLMTDAGRAVMPDVDEPLRIGDDILETLQSDAEAWENFRNFPELYQRIRIDNIQGYSRTKAEQERLISKLIQTAREGVMYGQWNDYGRLIEGERQV